MHKKSNSLQQRYSFGNMQRVEILLTCKTTHHINHCGDMGQ